MSDAANAGTETYAAILARWGLTGYFIICIFWGYQIDASNHLDVSHLATVLLIPFAMFVALERGAPLRRKFWGTRWDRRIFQILGTYLILRILLSYGNPYFGGQSAKVLLILTGLFCLKMLDPRGRNVRYWMWLIPTLLAVLIAAGIAHGLLTHNIGGQRFRVGPYQYEYVSELVCLTFPLWLFSLHSARRRKQILGLLAVGIVLLVGLILTDARGPLIGTLIAFLTFNFALKKVHRRTAAVGLIIAAIIIVVIPLASRAAGISVFRRYDIYADPTLSGRMVQWAWLTQQMLAHKTWIVFGAGFGRLVQWTWLSGLPQDGGFYRPSITDALLAAWVCLGILGILGYLYLYRYLWRRMSLTRYLLYRAMGMSLLAAYIFTDLFETHWEGTKMIWYVSFVFYLLTLPRPPLKSHEKQPAVEKANTRGIYPSGATLPQQARNLLT